MQIIDKKHIGLIENGINLDHIPCGNAFYIVRILNLHNSGQQVGIGLSLPSKKLGRKDLIKIENKVITNKEIADISLFCVDVTLSEILNFNVVKKTVINLPEIVKGIIVCPNQRCISHQHTSQFTTKKFYEKQIMLHCNYCEQIFPMSDIKQYNI